MVRNTFILLVALILATPSAAQIHELYKKNQTPEYSQVLAFYDSIAAQHDFFQLVQGSQTDCGEPLHLFVISKSKSFDPEAVHKSGRTVLFINNGIHPGEPDGVDACINITRQFALNPDLIPDSVVICIVPLYNIDGALQRNSVMRMNQNGPEEFGTRGNARNLDLNRDFVKCDSKNTVALMEFFHVWKPHVFIDTHVSNGADYQHVMTLILPNLEKHCRQESEFVVPTSLLVSIDSSMKSKQINICPYVETVREIPDSGIIEFNHTPRYCTGMTSLFNCISMVTETHMLKAYPLRVEATIAFLNSTINSMNRFVNEMVQWKRNRIMADAAAKTQFINWRNVLTYPNTIEFMGYEASYKTSNISGHQRLYYDRSKPWKRKIPFYKAMACDTVQLPKYYLIPQAWSEVVAVLKLNTVKLQQLVRDTTIDCEVTYIDSFKTSPRPYEGHYPHSNISTHTGKQLINFRKGDYLIPTSQVCSRYLAEVLEAKSNDGFFAWNFFDAILQQKEWFSDYVFEEVAEQILKDDPSIRKKLEETKKKDKALAGDHWSQLNFIFQHSKYKELTHNRYPVVKVR